MLLLPAFSITGADFDVALVPDGTWAPAPPGQVKLQNESPFSLQVAIGPDVHWMSPWTADVFEVHGGSTAMHVHPVALSAPLPPVAPTNALLVTVAAPFEQIPGVYPAALARQASIANQAVLLGTLSVGAAGGSASQTFTLPPGTQSVGYMLKNDGASYSTIQMTGNVSLVPYILVGSGIVRSSTELEVIDTAITCSATTAGASPAGTVFFFAYLYSTFMRVATVSGLPLPVIVTNSGGTPVPQVATTSSTYRNAPGALNTDFTIASVAATNTLFLFDFLVNTNAGANWEVQIWDGPSVNGLRIAVFLMIFATAVGNSPPIEWNGSGRPLGKGNNLVGTLVGGPAGATIYASAAVAIQ